MRTIIVTGCAGGIGSAICESFHQAGYRVLGLDLTAPSRAYETRALDLAALAEGSGDSLRAETGAALRDWCGGVLTALVHNAAHQVVKPLDALSGADWAATLAVNLSAPFFLTQLLADELRRGGGLVLAISSIHARLTKPGFCAYAASKGGLSALTQALALELAPQARAVAIAPAAIDTPMLRAGFSANPRALEALAEHHPAGRIGQADEIARLALFLAGDEARFITGSVIEIDGGIGHRLHDPV